jgi:hypothetical protein
MSDLKVEPSRVELQIVVRDKDGNIKYQGPLNMDITKQEEKGKEDGGHSYDSS